MHLLLIIFISILAVILIVFMAFKRIVSFLLGAVMGRKSDGQSYYGRNNSQQRSNQNNNSQTNAETEKVFSREEGEYVSFEEVE